MKSRDGKSRRDGKSQRRGERRRKKIKKGKPLKKADPGARKGRKVAKHCVFPMICGSGGSKSRLAKAAGAEPTGQMRLCEVEMSKKCTPLWREARFQVKMYKTPQLRSTLKVEMSKKCTPLWREAHFEVKMLKAPHARTTFRRSDVVSCGRCTGLCTLSKVSKTWGFCSISKNDGRRGTFKEDLQRCIFRGRRSNANTGLLTPPHQVGR